MSDIGTSASEELTLSARGYRLLKILGEGSYAKVYLADFRRASNASKAQLACKIVDIHKAPRDFVKKFLPRELEVLIKLNHPHVIHVHSIFQRKNKYFIFMRFAEQGDLLDFVSKKGAIPEPQARVWFRQMSLAIQYLHDLDIAHRDLKCENVLITNNFNVKIADYGFARFVADSNGKMITSETYCGSLSYAAPEILRGQPYYPKIADLWSFGVMLYVMVNKSMPFDDHNAKRLYEQQMNRKWKFRSKMVDTLSDKIKKLITAMLEPDTIKRLKIDQVLNSDWIAMDPRLIRLNSAELEAKRKTETPIKKTRGEKLGQEDKKSGRNKLVGPDELKVLKDISRTEYRLSDAADADTRGNK